MKAKRLSIVGFPESGKTSFLAAFWHLMHSNGGDAAFVIESLLGSQEHIMKISEGWLRCRVPERTALAEENSVELHLTRIDLEDSIFLAFPDISGEVFDRLFEERACDISLIESFGLSEGTLLFINAGANRAVESVALEDIDDMTDLYVDTIAPNARSDWQPSFVPEQVKLVDLLQVTSRPPFPTGRRHLAVIVSAWDVVKDIPSPQRWIERELPLLFQFLKSNNSIFETQYFGVSAQGGDFESAADVNRLFDSIPSERIRCVGSNGENLGFTAPIEWLLG